MVLYVCLHQGLLRPVIINPADTVGTLSALVTLGCQKAARVRLGDLSIDIRGRCLPDHGPGGVNFPRGAFIGFNGAVAISAVLVDKTSAGQKSRTT